MTESYSENRGLLVEEYNREPNHAVLTPHEYLRDAGREASTAKKNVGFQAMIFRPDYIGSLVVDIFKSVPKDQNVSKKLHVDWCSLLTSGNQQIDMFNALIPVVNFKVIDARLKRKEIFTKLREMGVDVIFSNPPKNIKEKFIPAFGRNHIKGCRIDNKVFYFGGVNLDQINVDGLADFMAKFTENLTHADELQFFSRNASIIYLTFLTLSINFSIKYLSHVAKCDTLFKV